ncbi:MAG: acyltransferase [Oscillatoria princeps RMCB-10]|jgi:peptidoglycan/LPS O-acetylase OafA/YrhL|nr:acyltransferase [Oscillatoria princeps RMCB-10]
MSHSKRFIELDVFRGIAALGVVLFHYTSQYSTLYKHSPELLFYFGWGRHGVELFFMISGFVILMTLEKTQRLLDFIWGRFSRLYPAYWTAVILTFTAVSIAGLPGMQVSIPNALLNLTMFQGFFDAPNVDDVYWTLQVELCFYILMAILYKTRLLKRLDAVATGWLVVASFYSVKTYIARWGYSLEEPTSFSDGSNLGNLGGHYHLMVLGVSTASSSAVEFLKTKLRDFFIFKYAHLFIAGMMLYKIKKNGFSAYRAALIVACVAAQRFAYSWENSWETTIFVAGCALLFILAIKGYLEFINWKPLIFMGTISYSLYLVHQNIGYAAIRWLYQYGVNPNASILIAIALSGCLAAAITFIIEKPALHKLRKLYEKTVVENPSV